MPGTKKMTDQIARDNHYVPQWYQRGFLHSGQAQLHYLDMSPQTKTLADGRVVRMNGIEKRAPKRCFVERDLYSTHSGWIVNDEVERFLFGPLDDKGSKAVRAFAEGDPTAMHHSFRDFFGYLDAQKLRTPKGLDWILSRYGRLDQVQLMVEMQGLRLMHATMWTEGVREIVSAEASDVKFIVSDHPVTMYNAAAPPTAPECTYPQDPPLDWRGSITLFPLNSETCIILTHVEYAKDETSSDLKTPRTNARYRGQTLARTDAFIRSRKLSRDHVVAINYVLKSRARRFVGAANRDWLFPELTFKGAWQDIAEVLRPKDELWRFGGEVYVGYADGSVRYQDAYGRTSPGHEHLRRKGGAPRSPGPNTPCPCGSGRKFKACCKDVPARERPSWEVYSIRERNLMLCRAARDIFGLNAGKSWEDVRRELADEQVKRIHQVFASLWPEDTDLASILPAPQNRRTRVVYLGVAHPMVIAGTVIGWLPYIDEIVVPHPFMNPGRLKPEYSPTESPSDHKAQTLKNTVLLFQLEPYIDAGVIHLVPDPGDFNAAFGMSALEMATERTADWRPGDFDSGWLERAMKADAQRLMLQMPEETLRAVMRRGATETSEPDVEAALEYARQELANDPFALLQPLTSQLTYYKGYSLESALYVAVLTGSGIFTDMEAHWDQLHRFALEGGEEQNIAWAPCVDLLQRLSLVLELDDGSALESLRRDRFGAFRQSLRRLAQAVRNSADEVRSSELAAELEHAGEAMRKDAAATAKPGQLLGRLKMSVPASGFKRREVQRLLVTFGGERTGRPVRFAFRIHFER